MGRKKKEVQVEKKVKVPKPLGAPKKLINWEQFEALCGLQCTSSECASFLKMNERTLTDKIKEHYNLTFTEVYKIYSELGQCSLRRNLFAMSKANAQVAIHLSKVYLDMNYAQKVETKQEITQKALLELPDNDNR